MNGPPDAQVGDSLDHSLGDLLRDLAPRVLATLARRGSDFGAAEDAVQEALLAATTTWPQHGIPDHPAGWLYHVARRRLLDHHDSEASRAQREAAVALPEVTWADAGDDLDDPLRATGDDTLTLLFLCCHPSLAAPSAIALTLRAVGGLSTAAIAHAFLVPEPTMAQRISRAKATIQASGVPFTRPGQAELAQRLLAVLRVLYLMFTEGHTTTHGPTLHRLDLAEQALRLCRLLCELVPDHAESRGLLALMLLTEARRTARTGTHGQLIPLQEQDRSQWNPQQIAEGTVLVSKALAQGQVGPYQVQAAIAALHDEAPSIEATDWPQILALYTLLLHMQQNPMVALNRAIAVAMVQGPAAGLAAVATLEADPRLAVGHRLPAVRGHLRELAGDHEGAIRDYLAAAALTANLPERQYLQGKVLRLRT